MLQGASEVAGGPSLGVEVQEEARQGDIGLLGQALIAGGEGAAAGGEQASLGVEVFPGEPERFSLDQGRSKHRTRECIADSGRAPEKQKAPRSGGASGGMGNR
jgi:hypothetical protein